MDRLTLERYQVGIYLLAIGFGLGAGVAWPAIRPWCEALLWPSLTILLYATFVQVPLLHLRTAFADHRFITALLIGNFVLVPLLIWGLLAWLPPDPALRLGVLLVLLVPCTDWFLTFSQLGEGDVPRAIAVTPLNLVLQLLLLPVYLWLLADESVSAAFSFEHVGPALLIVLLPLALAVFSERWMEQRIERQALRTRLAWWPVPLLACVVFLIAGAQVHAVMSAPDLLLIILPVFIVFLVAAALLAKGLAWAWQLPAAQGRTLAFSLGTRNSFVVLPFALTLPANWEIAAVVIVLQSLVELFGMVAYLWWLPRHLFPSLRTTGGPLT